MGSLSELLASLSRQMQGIDEDLEYTEHELSSRMLSQARRRTLEAHQRRLRRRRGNVFELLAEAERLIERQQ